MMQSKDVALMSLLLFAFMFFFGAAAVSFVDYVGDEEVVAAYDYGFKAGVDSVQVIVEDEPAKSHQVPLYLQTDPQWSGEQYSSGTIGSHGCGLVSAAIATSYLLDEDITPDILSKSAGDAFLSNGLNDSDAICRWLSEHYGLKWTGEKWLLQDAVQMLDEGYVVLASMKGQLGDENYGGHVVLLYEHTDDDCFYLRDPFSGDNSVRKFSRQEIEQVDWGSFNGLC